jgi:hypothetical protein
MSLATAKVEKYNAYGVITYAITKSFCHSEERSDEESGFLRLEEPRVGCGRNDNQQLAMTTTWNWPAHSAEYCNCSSASAGFAVTVDSRSGLNKETACQT